MKISLIVAFCMISVNSFSQEKELEKFNAALTSFVNYDNDKASVKSEANTAKLRKDMEDAFLQFALHRQSNNLESLRKNGQTDGKNNYWFVSRSYSFGNVRRDMMMKSLENNVDYKITFSGLYDYQLSNFVSVYIQPFTSGKEEFAVYYYKLNGIGKYYIKDIASNKIVFSSEAFTSNAPIRTFSKIGQDHLLLIEDMGDNGQRALVLKLNPKMWEKTAAFKGNAFPENTTDYSKKIFAEKRTYLRLASSKIINSHYTPFDLKKQQLAFDEKSNTISYSISKDNSKSIQAKWENNGFNMDDYYQGQHLIDEPMPYPDR